MPGAFDRRATPRGGMHRRSIRGRNCDRQYLGQKSPQFFTRLEHAPPSEICQQVGLYWCEARQRPGILPDCAVVRKTR